MIDYYNADVTTANDYYPGGMELPTRTYSNGNKYRYGFNGKEQDREEPLQYDYGFRIYDPRIVRFKSLDPLQKKFPELTPYQFASNSPIANIDLDGLEAYQYSIIFDKKGQAFLQYEGVHKRQPTFWQEATDGLFGIHYDPSEYKGDLIPLIYSLTYNGNAISFQTVKQMVGFVEKIPINQKNAATQAEIEKVDQMGQILLYEGIAELYSESDMQDGHFDGDVPLPPTLPNKQVKAIHNRNEEVGASEVVAPPSRAYNRVKDYGKTPTKADRKALGAKVGEDVDHNLALVKHFYEGKGGKPGYSMTKKERRAFATDRTNMTVVPSSKNRSDGGKLTKYSKQKKVEHKLK